jgi:hypothetical protein
MTNLLFNKNLKVMINERTEQLEGSLDEIFEQDRVFHTR